MSENDTSNAAPLIISNFISEKSILFFSFIIFFSVIFFFFSLEYISDVVLGVLLDILLLGLQYGTPLPSPFVRPQGFPVLTSTHFSLNHRFNDAPFLVFLTAIISFYLFFFYI